MKTFSFAKPEHLCLKRDIETLFSAGSRAATAYPLRAVFRTVPAEGGPRVQVLISVPKRRLHHAVDRNRAKRQIREAYRLNKAVLVDAVPADARLHLAFLWLADGPVASAVVAEKVKHLVARLAERVGQEQNALAKW